MQLCKSRDKNHQLVNILLLGKRIDKDTLLWAVKQANATGTPSYEMVCFYLEIQAVNANDNTVIDDGVKVKAVDLESYDNLIKGGHLTHEGNE